MDDKSGNTMLALH